jgi:hypothetical protein
MYNLKRDIAERISEKSYLLKQVLNGKEVATTEYVIVYALMSSIIDQYENKISDSELEKQLKKEYTTYLVNSYDDSDLLNSLIDIEREEALSEPTTELEFDVLGIGCNQIGF